MKLQLHHALRRNAGERIDYLRGAIDLSAALLHWRAATLCRRVLIQAFPAQL